MSETKTQSLTPHQPQAIINKGEQRERVGNSEEKIESERESKYHQNREELKKGRREIRED